MWLNDQDSLKTCPDFLFKTDYLLGYNEIFSVVYSFGEWSKVFLIAKGINKYMNKPTLNNFKSHVSFEVLEDCVISFFHSPFDFKVL